MSSEAIRRAVKKYQKTPKGRQCIARAIKKWRLKLKIEVLAHYGNGKCACVKCGEEHIACLSIDHMMGGGGNHKKQIGGAVMLYPWLKKQGYPDGYQTLCMNCQWKKRFANREVRGFTSRGEYT